MKNKQLTNKLTYIMKFKKKRYKMKTPHRNKKKLKQPQQIDEHRLYIYICMAIF